MEKMICPPGVGYLATDRRSSEYSAAAENERQTHSAVHSSIKIRVLSAIADGEAFSFLCPSL